MYWTLLKDSIRFDTDSLSSLSGGKGVPIPSGSLNNDTGDSLWVGQGMQEVVSLYEKFGADDDRTQSQLYIETNICLFESMKDFVVGDHATGHQKLVALSRSVNQYASLAAVNHFVFSINRVQAVGYYLGNNLTMCVEHLNTCVSECPKRNGNQAPGLADVLILLSEVYHTLGYSEEALQASRLCVDVALTRLEKFEGQSASSALKSFTDDNGRTKFFDRSIGPALDEYTAMAAAYQTLGQQLQSQGIDNLGIEWIERALNTATKFGLDFSYITTLRQLLDKSKNYLENSNSDNSKNSGENNTIKNVDYDMKDKGGLGLGSSEGLADGDGYLSLTDRSRTSSSRGSKSKYARRLNTNPDAVASGLIERQRDSAKITMDIEPDGDGLGSPSRGQQSQNASPDAAGKEESNTPGRQNRPKSAIGKLGGQYAQSNLRNRATSLTGHNRDRQSAEESKSSGTGVVVASNKFNTDKALGVVTAGWQSMHSEIQNNIGGSGDGTGQHIRPGSGGVVAMLPSNVVKNKQKRPTNGPSGKRKKVGRSSTAPGGSRSHHSGTNKPGGTEDLQYIPPSKKPGDLSASDLIQIADQSSTGNGDIELEIMYRSGKEGAAGNVYSPEGGMAAMSNYIPPKSGQGASAPGHTYYQESSSTIDIHAMQRQIYGYSAVDILDGDISLEIVDLSDEGQPSGRYTSKYTRGYDALQMLETGNLPQKRDTRDVRERTIGKTSIVQRQIDAAIRRKKYEREETRMRNLRNAAARVDKERKILELEKLRMQAEKERSLEAIEVERRRAQEVAEEQTRLAAKAIKERDRAEKRVVQVVDKLSREKSSAKDSKERAERSLAAEKMRLEAEMAEKLKAKLNRLQKEEKKREIAFAKEKTVILEALKAQQEELKLQQSKELQKHQPMDKELHSPESKAPPSLDMAIPSVTEGKIDKNDIATKADPESTLVDPKDDRVSTAKAGPSPPRSNPLSAKRGGKTKASKPPLSVKQLPTGKQPRPPASAQRRRLIADMNNFMSRVKVEAEARLDATERAIQILYFQSAQRIQRVVRGMLCRSDQVLKQALTRALRLRRRERELEAREQSLQEKAVELQNVEVPSHTVEEPLLSISPQRVEAHDQPDSSALPLPGAIEKTGEHSDESLFQLDTSSVMSNKSQVSLASSTAVALAALSAKEGIARVSSRYSPDRVDESVPAKVVSHPLMLGGAKGHEKTIASNPVLRVAGQEEEQSMHTVPSQDVHKTSSEKNDIAADSAVHTNADGGSSTQKKANSRIIVADTDNSTKSHSDEPQNTWARKLSSAFTSAASFLSSKQEVLGESEAPPSSVSAKTVVPSLDVNKPQTQPEYKTAPLKITLESPELSDGIGENLINNRATASPASPVLMTNPVSVSIDTARIDFQQLIDVSDTYKSSKMGVQSLEEEVEDHLTRVAPFQSSVSHSTNDGTTSMIESVIATIERMTALSDLYFDEGAYESAIVIRDQSLRLYLRFMRIFPDEDLVPETMEHKRLVFSRRQSSLLGRRMQPIEAREKPINLMPKEFTMNIINFLINAAFHAEIPWLVEAYYREAMELKFGVSSLVGKEAHPIVIPSPLPSSLKKIKIANVAATANIPLPLEIIDLEKKLLVFNVPSDLGGGELSQSAQESNPQLEERLSLLCENAAKHYLSIDAVGPAISIRERAFRAMRAPPVAYSVRILGSLGALSRIEGNLVAAKAYFNEMCSIGAALTLGQRAVSSASAEVDAVEYSSADVDFAYYQSHLADLLRIGGHHSHASILLQEACPVLETCLGSEYEHYATAAAKKTLYLTLVGVETEIAAFLDIRSSMPPCSPDLTLQAASTTDIAFTSPRPQVYGGKCRGCILSAGLVVPIDRAADILYPLRSSRNVANLAQSDPLMSVHEKREILEHAKLFLSTDPIHLAMKYTDELQGFRDGRNTPLGMSIKRLLDSAPSGEQGRGVDSPTNPQMTESALLIRDAELKDLLKRQHRKHHDIFGKYLSGHALSMYMYEAGWEGDHDHNKQRILDIDALRSKVCHLLDPTCCFAVSVLSHYEYDSCLRHFQNLSASAHVTERLPVRRLYPPMAFGRRPLDTEWPDDAPQKNQPEDTRMLADDSISINTGTFGQGTLMGGDNYPNFAISRGTSTQDAFGADTMSGPSYGLAVMKIHSVVAFDLSPLSLMNTHKMQPMFDWDISGIQTGTLTNQSSLNTESRGKKVLSGKFDWRAIEEDANNRNGADSNKEAHINGKDNLSDLHPNGRSSDSVFSLAIKIGGEGWELPLSEESLSRMASAGEWMKFRLLKQAPETSDESVHTNELKPLRIPVGIHSPPHVWLRSSIVFLGTLMDCFSRIWSLHVEWAAHHIINSAAIEEMISFSVLDGIRATRRGPGGAKHIVEGSHIKFEGLGSKPARYGPMLPTKRSNSSIHRHVGRSSRRVGWNHLQPLDPSHSSRGGISSNLMKQFSYGSTDAVDAVLSSCNSIEGDSIKNLKSGEGNPWDAGSLVSNSGSVIREDRAKNVSEDTHVPNNERTAEVEYVFQACRQGYLECHIDATRAEGRLKKCLRKWEFDPRRQHGTLHDRGSIGEEEFRKRLPPLSTETIIGHKMKEVAGGLYTVLLHMTIHHNDEGGHKNEGYNSDLFSIFRGKHASNTNSEDGGAPSQSMLGMCMTKGSWENIYSALWNLVEVAIIDSLQLLIDCTGIDFGITAEDAAKLDPMDINPVAQPMAAKLREVVTCATISCQLGLVGALEKLRAFDWISFRQRKKNWAKIITDERIGELVRDAEALVYAPISQLERGFLKDMLDLGQSAHADNKAPGPQGKGTAADVKEIKRAPTKINLKTGDVHRSEQSGFGSTHGVSLPLTPLYLRNDEPLVRGILDLIAEKVREFHSPRSDIMDRAAGAGEEACTQQ